MHKGTARRGSRFFYRRHNMARKPFEELNFADDGMFQAVMKNPEASAELVKRLLGLRVKSVKYPKLEKKIAPYYACDWTYI